MVVLERLIAFLRWLARQWQEAHEESLAPAAGGSRKKGAAAPPKVDYRVLVILVTVAVSLTIQEYWGDREVFARLTTKGWFGPIPNRWWELWSFVWWTGWRVFGYLLMPMAVIAALPGERIRAYGWSLRGFAEHLWIYVLLFVLVAPLIYLTSQTEAFRNIYPFYRQAHKSTFELVTWELLYALQFLSLEFFFRGFMIQGLKRQLGVYSIAVMIVPYCMIHYGKTAAETFGSIVAGLVLGTIALRTGSIWGGVLIHVGVAVMMDLLCVRSMP